MATDAQRRALGDFAARQEIATVLAVHSRGVDRADYGLLASAYHPGATVDYGFFDGPAEQMASILAGALKGQPVTLHRTSNIYARIDGDTATSESYVVAYMEHAEPEGAVQRFVGGRYLDRLALRNGQWRLTHRTYVMDWNSTRPSTAAWGEPAVSPQQFAPRGSQGASDAGRAALAMGAAAYRTQGAFTVSQTPTDQQIDVALSKQAIMDLCAVYSRAVDRVDAELLGSIFHEDSTVVTGVINGSGAEFATGITAFVKQNLTRVFHTFSNSWVEVKGDEAIGEHYALATMTAGDTDIWTGGRYIDAYKRRNGVWKISSRTFVTDWTTTQPTTYKTDGMFDPLKLRGCYGKSDPVYAFWAKG